MAKRQRRTTGGIYPMIPVGTGIGFRSTGTFYPRLLLLWKPEPVIMTDDFRRLVLPLLNAIRGSEEKHQYIYMVTETKSFEDFKWLMHRPGARCDARSIIHMLGRQINEGIGYFSDEFVNFARVTESVWIRLHMVRVDKPIRGRRLVWVLHAFDTEDPAFKERSKRFKIKVGMQVITGRSAP